MEIVVQGCFKGVKGSYKKVPCVFQKNSKKGLKDVSRCFIEFLFCNFVVAWHSSKLPEQKEGFELNLWL